MNNLKCNDKERMKLSNKFRAWITLWVIVISWWGIWCFFHRENIRDSHLVGWVLLILVSWDYWARTFVVMNFPWWQSSFFTQTWIEKHDQFTMTLCLCRNRFISMSIEFFWLTYFKCIWPYVSVIMNLF